MCALRAEFERDATRKLKYDEIAELTGESASTAFERMNRNQQPQIEGFIRLLERLPAPVRDRLIKEFFRRCPCLEDAMLGHDATQVSSLRELMNSKERGVTLVYGANAAARTLVVTALARAEPGRLRGLDKHIPDWFVGAAGVCYAGTVLTPGRLQSWVTSHWELTRAPVVLINGLWFDLTNELRHKVATLARERHLLLADQFEPAVIKTLPLTPPVHAIQVCAPTLDRIHVCVHAR
jgi:hypothetical protein